MSVAGHPWEQPPSGASAAIAAALSAQVPVLTTARLCLRAPRMQDFAGWVQIATTDRGRFIGGPMSREEAWADFNQMVAGWLLRGHGLWSVERLSDGALLGFVPVNHEWGDPQAELGFLFLAEAEGQGYAAEAALAARDFCFTRLGWPEVVSYIDPENSRSMALARRLGAVELPAGSHPAEPDVAVFRHSRPEGAQ
jgi:RimJ/RimL family protein N-acetyltransferase